MITSINFTEDFHVVIPLSLHKTIKMMEVKKKKVFKKVGRKDPHVFDTECSILHDLASDFPFEFCHVPVYIFFFFIHPNQSISKSSLMF